MIEIEFMPYVQLVEYLVLLIIIFIGAIKMGLFRINKKNFASEEDEYSLEDDDNEEEFDFRKEVRCMTEKQLLKLLVILTWENNIDTITNSDLELIKIAKEE